MPLQPTQRALLEQYQQFRIKPPTIWRLISMSATGYAAFLILMAALIAFWVALDQAGNVAFVLGVVFGFIAQNLLVLRTSVRLWPTVSDVLDWEKLDEIVSAHAEHAE